MSGSKKKTTVKKSIKRSSAARAMHTGVLTIGEMKIDCAVLENGQRVISQGGVLKALDVRVGGRARERADGAGLPVFVGDSAIIPFVSNQLRIRPLEYRDPRGGKPAKGLPASSLRLICEAWLDARKAGALDQPSQLRVADNAETLIRGFAEVGIAALIDEATGFQKKREPDALQTMMDLFLLPYMAKWSKRFPDEFYKGIYRLRGWAWTPDSTARPQCIASYTKDLIYARLAPGVLHELEERTPKDEDGKRRGRFHQFFTTDVGHPALSQHLHATIGFMRASSSWEQFMRFMNAVYPRRGDSLMLPGFVEAAAVQG